ncbi:MAG: insulinase family protein [Candidatus Falkowbacteria bacterium]
MADDHDFKTGQTVHGFLVKEVRPIPGLETTAIVLTHAATGARYLHLANKDSENAFGIGFKTIPQDSTGVAHILEHTVLTGSKKYPVRDPFFSMVKRSLKSFMNAFTANDWTFYPFATPNQKDYYNLMSVYLDAVFFPTITRLNFMQEGHRLEIDANGRITRQGVVYGEMKGAMSTPNHIEAEAINQALFTGNYRFNSGGDPAVIPTLTHDALVAFHKRFYHPSNSFIFSYGNLPLTENLRFVDGIFEGFEAIDPKTTVAPEPKRSAPIYVHRTYAAPADEDLTKKFQAIMTWITAPVEDAYEIMVLKLLTIILLGNAASPLKKALIDSGLGSALTHVIGLEDGEYREAVFSCGLKDIKEADARAVEKVILDTLGALATEGIDPELVESAIHRMELKQKELKDHGWPRGLTLALKLAESWFHGENPLGPLEFNVHIDRIRQEVKTGLLTDRIKKYFLLNNNRALITLVPDPNKQRNEEARRQKELAELEEKLTIADRKAIRRDAQALKDLQERTVDLSCLPTLELSDIPPEIKTIKDMPLKKNPRLTAYEQPTNGILYFISYFDAAALPENLIPYVPIFSWALPKIGTKTKNYEKIVRQISLKTGGVGLGATAHSTANGADECLPLLELGTKCLERNIEATFGIIHELIHEFSFSDLKRLKVILEEMRTAYESSIQQNGHAYARSLASRGLSPATHLNEEWGGIHLLLTVKKLLAGGEESLKKLAVDLEKIGHILFTGKNCQIALIATKPLLNKAAAAAGQLLDSLPTLTNPRSDHGISDRAIKMTVGARPVTHLMSPEHAKPPPTKTRMPPS